MEATYAELLEAFGARQSGSGWDGHCPLAARHHRMDSRPSLRLWIGARGELVCRCYGCGAKWSEIAAAVNSVPRDWWPHDPQTSDPNRRNRPVSKTVAIYEYRDERGALVAEKHRKEPGPSGAKKSFSWRRPLPVELRADRNVPADRPAWVWGMREGLYAPHEGDPCDWRFCHGPPPAGAVELPALSAGPYRLPELLSCPLEHPVIFVEGERKADLVRRLTGALAVCGPNGAYAWDWRWADHFYARKVIVFPDNNPPGIAHATSVAGTLLYAGASAVKLIRPGDLWPIEPEQDVADWLVRFSPKEARARLVQLTSLFPAYSI